jgi:hypothetical protein
MQPAGRMGEKITVLCTVQRWTGMSLQSAARAFSRPGAPSTMVSSGVFKPRLTRSSRSARQAASLSPPMFLTAKRIFWHTERDQQRNRCRLLVEPHAHGSAIQDEPDDRRVLQGARVPGIPVAFHLAPGPANHILAHRAFENRRKRATHAASVGPGQIGARDQSFGLFRAPLVGPQRPALPRRRLAVFTDDPGTRDGELIPAAVGPNVPVSDRVR